VPLYYDNRGEKLDIARPDLNDRIVEILQRLELDQDEEEKLKRELSREYPILTAPERLERIAGDLVAHFSARWLTGKSMLVCLDKITCVKMYELIAKHWAAEIANQKRAVATAEDEQAMLEAQRKLQWFEETKFRVMRLRSLSPTSCFTLLGGDGRLRWIKYKIRRNVAYMKQQCQAKV
jgi:type I restriction enzyme R subunit